MNKFRVHYQYGNEIKVDEVEASLIFYDTDRTGLVTFYVDDPDDPPHGTIPKVGYANLVKVEALDVE